MKKVFIVTIIFFLALISIKSVTAQECSKGQESKAILEKYCQNDNIISFSEQIDSRIHMKIAESNQSKYSYVTINYKNKQITSFHYEKNKIPIVKTVSIINTPFLCVLISGGNLSKCFSSSFRDLFCIIETESESFLNTPIPAKNILGIKLSQADEVQYLASDDFNDDKIYLEQLCLSSIFNIPDLFIFEHGDYYETLERSFINR
jgi:uncharacterized protein YxeA